jgi:hypothetical protein
MALAAGAAALALSGMTPAGAWGAQGHQYVGSLAWALLNPSARAHVAALLGPKVDLSHAAVWADCVRSVSQSSGPAFVFKADERMPQACKVFADKGAEEARITDYAARNWTNCDYAGQRRACNLAFHFADVNVLRHDRYDESYFGAGPADVVQAIKAATIVLQCPDAQPCPAPAPFDFKDKREALLLLAHFMGDVHQPLHVGAVYLNPTNVAGDDHGRPTTGGNSLLVAPNENLHHDWDTISTSLATGPSAAAVASACRLLRSTKAPGTPEDWASGTVIAAAAAYKGLTYRADAAQPNKYWDVSFADPGRYAADRVKSQTAQLEKAGVRLAALLNTIWPSPKPAADCARTLKPAHRSRR